MVNLSCIGLFPPRTRIRIVQWDVFNFCYFADEAKNIKPKEELEEEKHSKMVIDSESPNEKSESENGKLIVQRRY